MEKNTYSVALSAVAFSRGKPVRDHDLVTAAATPYLEKPGEQTRVGSGDVDLWSQEVLIENTTEQATEDMKKA